VRSACADVIVIGAGLAGLEAARLLEAGGARVRMIEAQQRVGGRIHSMRQLGSNAEAGGTYIGAGYERVIAAAERHGIGLIDVTPLLEFFREQALALGGELISQRDWPAHPANPFTGDDRRVMPWNFHRVLTMRDNPLASAADWLDPRHFDLDVSMRDWMRSRGLDDDGIAIGYGINTSFGDDAADVSALLMLGRAAFSREQRMHAPEGVLGFTVEGGVDRLPAAMAEGLASEVVLGRPVAAIDDDGTRVRVTCADGSRFEGSHVVAAVPFGALAEVAIDPPLGGLHAEAVAAIASQAVTQVYIAAKKPFWEEDGWPPSLFTDTIAGMVAGVRSGADPAHVTHLTAWAFGPGARRLDALAPAEAGRLVIEAIERLRPAARGALELIDLKSWGNDPYARGAWATFKPGQVARFGRTIGAPHGRVRFCGEHLARSARGMEAALETAEHAAADILSSA
jgi:monoamine oxidase